MAGARVSLEEGRGVSILVPAFNEERVIGRVVDELLERYPAAQVIACDDGSSDGTAEVLNRTQATLLRHPRNRGYGATWRTLLVAARHETVVFFDGDGQFHVEDVGRLLEVHRKSGADLTSGARVGSDGKPLLRRPAKWLLAAFAARMSGFRPPDLNCGLRVFRREALELFMPYLPDGFSASTTSMIGLLATGGNVQFVPIRARDRIGRSSVRPIRDGIRTVLLVVRLATMFGPLRVFAPPAVVLFLAGSAYSLASALSGGRGVPVLGAIAIITGIFTLALGVISDQVSFPQVGHLRLRLSEQRTALSAIIREPEGN